MNPNSGDQNEDTWMTEQKIPYLWFLIHHSKDLLFQPLGMSPLQKRLHRGRDDIYKSLICMSATPLHLSTECWLWSRKDHRCLKQILSHLWKNMLSMSRSIMSTGFPNKTVKEGNYPSHTGWKTSLPTICRIRIQALSLSINSSRPNAVLSRGNLKICYLCADLIPPLSITCISLPEWFPHVSAKTKE